MRTIESTSVEDEVIQVPKSIVIVPEPDVEVGSEKPVNSKVCDVANAEIFMSEVKAFAMLGEVTLKVVLVSALDVTNFVLSLNVNTLVFKVSNSEATSPKPKSVKFVCQFYHLITFFGSVSALTKLSTS